MSPLHVLIDDAEVLKYIVELGHIGPAIHEQDVHKHSVSRLFNEPLLKCNVPALIRNGANPVSIAKPIVIASIHLGVKAFRY